MTTQAASAVLLGAVLLASVPAGAQDKGVTTPDQLDKDVTLIPFKNGEPYKGGRLLYVEGVSDSTRPLRYGLEGLSITQPVSVSVITRPPRGKLTLTAVKWGSKAPGKQVETDQRGAASLSFRVPRDAQLVVQGSGEKTPFQLMVWVGPELKPPLKSPFTSAKAEALRAPKGGAR